MAALMRCTALRSRSLGQSLFYLFSATRNNGSALATNQRYVVSAAQDKDRLVDLVHNKIDYNQGISTDLFSELFSSLNKFGSLTEHDFGLLLHICSFGPFDSPTSKRLELVDEIWNKLGVAGIEPSTRLYNSRLKAYCANQQKFDPLQELTNMKSLGLNPDKVTYRLLIEGFCLNGDIEGANKVLETMKECEHVLGIGIFNSFITGHLKAGSPEEAANILEVLRSRGLSPNSDTYFRFASHYAEEGDITSVMKYITEAESANVPMEHSNLLEIYKLMASSGHSDKSGELLKAISEKGVFRIASIHKSCQLVSEGFNEAAFQLFLALPKNLDGKLIPNSGSFLLKAMIINGQSADEVMDMADKIVEYDPKTLPHRNALLYAFKADRTDLAMQLLELMKAKNHQIKAPHIVPAICSYRTQKNKEGVYKATRMLLGLPENANRDDKIDQLLNSSCPAFSFLGESREDIINNFKEKESTWNFIFFVQDIMSKGYTTALENAAGKQMAGSLFSWDDLNTVLSKYLPEEWESCVDVLHFISQQKGVGRESLLSLCADVVKTLVIRKDWDTLDKVVVAMLDKNLLLRPRFRQFNLLAEAPEELQKKLDKLCDAKTQRRTGDPALNMEKFEAMTKEELEQYQKNNPNFNMPRLALLNKAIAAEDLDEMKQKLRELQAVGFKMNIRQILKVVSTLTRLGDIETATQYFEELKKLVDNSFRDTIPIGIAAQHAKAGNMKGALEMIRIASRSTFVKDEKSRNPRLAALRDMFENAPSLNDASALHSEVFSVGSIVPESDAMIVHGMYINRVINQDDDDELIRRLMKLHEQFHVCPSMDKVLVRFIEKQDVDRLKRVMDLGITVFGSNTFHNRLAICFIQCGMPARASTVLQTPGLRINERVIQSGCQQFLRMKRVDCLESLSEITKNLPVSQAFILRYLVEAYVAVNDLKKATDTFQQFAENFVEPPKSTVDLLDRAHRSQNLEVPESVKAYVSKTKPAGDQIISAATSSSSSESSSESDSDRESSSPESPAQESGSITEGQSTSGPRTDQSLSGKSSTDTSSSVDGTTKS